MTTKTRKTYIGKERDDESYLGDFGARLAWFLCKYDYAVGPLHLAGYAVGEVNGLESVSVLWE